MRRRSRRIRQHGGRSRYLGALSFTVLLDLSGPLVSRFGKGEVNAAGALLDDTQARGIENSPDNGQADEEEQDKTGQSTQHEPT